MVKRALGVMCVAGMAAAAASSTLAQEVDIQKAVNCQTLAQQFGDSIKTAKADDAARLRRPIRPNRVIRPATSTTTTPAWDQLRQALQQVGLKPAR